MYKPISTDPKCSFSVSLPVSILKAMEQYLHKKSRSELIKEAVILWLREKTVRHES